MQPCARAAGGQIGAGVRGAGRRVPRSVRRPASVDRGRQWHPLARRDARDFSASAIAAEVAWLRAFRGRLDALDPAPLTADERVDRRILQGIVDGWLLDLDYGPHLDDEPDDLRVGDLLGRPQPDDDGVVAGASEGAQAASKLAAVPQLLRRRART
jgi:hypothetical protein